MKITVNPKLETGSLGDLFGIFFEDINHAADGGLYAELLQNRSFEFCELDNPGYHGLTGWEKIIPGDITCSVSVQTGNPVSSKNPHYLVIDACEPSEGVGVRNCGYNSGIPLEAGKHYELSFYTACDGRLQTVEAALENMDGEIYESRIFQITSREWVMLSTEFIAPVTNYSARLSIKLKSAGRVYFDLVSLFPIDTFRNRKNGMRVDIAKLLEDMKPKFMRFPGGCLIHDGSLNQSDRDSMYRWKNTIGPLKDRPSRRNNWNYNQTLGLGYYEYFQLCEDIGAKPLPVLPGGCDPHHRRAVPLKQLEEWIQDALDLIEFANGSENTVWGAKRAELGHREPFHLKYIAIGNEEVGDDFFERYSFFQKAIKEKYPHIKIINSAGPAVSGSAYDTGWKSAVENGSELIDEHYYQAPEWFIANHHHYDSYRKRKTKVFLGEYASKGNSWYNALAEASYMIGLERNAEGVGLACYAPMLCNAGYVDWKPNLIWFDNHRAFGTPNYYVQKLFMNNQGDFGLKVDIETDMKSEALPDKMGKKIYFAPNLRNADSRVEIKNIEIIKEEGLVRCPDILVDSAADPIFIGEAEGSYRIKFHAKRISGGLGFALWFNFMDEQNKRRVEYGGWENQNSSVEEDIDGRNTSFDQGAFSIKSGVVYEIELIVGHERIVNKIDGKIMNEVDCPAAVIEPIYCTASRDEESRDIIVKAVNLKAESYEAEIALSELEISSAEVCCMSGYALTDENSFDEPEKVSPATTSVFVDKGIVKYMVPAESVSIFRLKETVILDESVGKE
ncbi:alpha-L-arabinofuranosidase [Hungatella effluvii]|uniref:non-reducing end alpha-L-arabinofuranosidase n=1 Tax=Hungatella effluvii TaxID=1096246 RepID=A0A2V3YG08_9FIRM|nr:alpha-L-arabinofuranosidase C-terminal domain-containing protein [Hungatella effluvii]PXX52003.1 alpha-L-arabinofuranosidase [Hungatella effluvii]